MTVWEELEALRKRTADHEKDHARLVELVTKYADHFGLMVSNLRAIHDYASEREFSIGMGQIRDAVSDLLTMVGEPITPVPKRSTDT